MFWDLLRDQAEAQRVPINALVARIDAQRIEADEPVGLASAIRQYLVRKLADGGDQQSPPPVS